MAQEVSIVTWNLEWARPTTPRGEEITRRLSAHAPAVACLTEADQDFFQGSGHTIAAMADYGYPAPAWRRKVVLWSERPWRSVDVVGDPGLPTGRFVSGITETNLGPVRITGVCIPWTDAHVRSGRRDRTPWEDHLLYLKGLRNYLEQTHGPHVVLGDFNQTNPRTRAPIEVFNALQNAFSDTFTYATEALADAHGKLAIDHVVHSSELSPTSAIIIPNDWEDGKRLSDHFGIAVRLSRPSWK